MVPLRQIQQALEVTRTTYNLQDAEASIIVSCIKALAQSQKDLATKLAANHREARRAEVALAKISVAYALADFEEDRIDRRWTGK